MSRYSRVTALAGKVQKFLAKRQSNGFVIPPSLCEEMEQKFSASKQEIVESMMELQREHAHVPISGFQVGAALLAKSGTIYAGVNIETPHILGLTVHGEQCTVLNAYHHGDTDVELLCVSDYPCGHCRQFLNELPDAADLTVLIPPKTPDEKEVLVKFEKLLPHAFGASSMGGDWALDSNVNNNLEQYCVEESDWETCDSDSDSDEDSDQDEELFQLAFAAANRAYTPYTACPSGVAVRLSDGFTASGSCIESAAYNPSVSPMQSLSVWMLVNGRINCMASIKEVVLVELAGQLVSQLESTRQFLDHWGASDARVKVVKLQK